MQQAVCALMIEVQIHFGVNHASHNTQSSKRNGRICNVTSLCSQLDKAKHLVNLTKDMLLRKIRSVDVI